MKKTLVALSVAAFAAASANAAVVYNQDGTKLDVNGSVRVALTKQTGHRLDLDNDGSRVIFNFSQDLGEGFSALGYVELRPGKEDETGDWSGVYTKQLYAGLAQSDIGTLTFGKQKTAADDFKLADPTENGLSVLDFDGLNQNHYLNGVATEGSKVVRFVSKDFAGFGFQTSYTFGESDKAKAITRGVQVLATYANDFGGLGFQAHALYADHKGNTEDKLYPSALETRSWGLAAKVSYAGFGLATDYVQGKLTHDQLNIDTKGKAWSVAATYQVVEPLDVYATYTHIKAEHVGTATLKGITVGTHYQVAKNVQTYVEYDTVKLEQFDRVNKFYTGLRVFF